MGEGVLRFQGNGREISLVVNLVQDHADSIGIHSLVQDFHVILYFRRCIAAAVFTGKGSIGQGIQLDKAKITDSILLFPGKEDI